jgi:predicted SprT family Zn-dependent metalloprotease
MDLSRATMMAVDCMNYHGLLNRGWQFKLDSAKRRHGVCRRWCRTISISEAVTLLNSEDEVLDTILHEIAHAIAPAGAHHGPQWKLVAREVGARPQRCASTSSVSVPHLWEGYCSDCPAIAKRHRMPNDNMRTTGYHTPCRGKSNRGKLVWKYVGKGKQINPPSQYVRTIISTIDATQASV